MSDYGEEGGRELAEKSEASSESGSDNIGDFFDDSGGELERNKELDFDGKLDFDNMEEIDFDGKLDFNNMEEIDFDGKLDFSEIDEFNEEKRLENSKDNERCEIDWSEANSDIPGEQEESIWKEINWNDSEPGEIDDDLPEIFGETREIDDDLPEIFDEPGEIDDDLPEIFDESGEIDDDLPEIFGETASEGDDDLSEIFGEPDESNESNEAEEPDQFNPNEGNENSNESDQYEMGGDDESNYDPYEYGDNFEQEGNSEGFYENFNAESMNTVLLSENLIYAYLKEYVELMVENEAEMGVQGEQVDVDNSKGDISELEEFLNEERERIRLEQQQAGLDDIIEPEPELVAKEVDVEQEQEKEVGNQENVSEEMVPNNEEEVENQEMKLEEELQSALPNESIESGKVEEIEEKNEELQSYGIEENIEERENKLKGDDEKKEKYEQHQSKTQIEEEYDTEFEPIAHENELDIIKEEDEEKEELEEFTKEGALSQISQELEVIHEINSNETEVLTNSQEEELEQDYISPYREKQREIEEYKDPQQELEENLEQTRKIEQETLIEVEQEQEKSDKNIEENYEKAKKLYNQETGKRPIYANNETEGFKQWLEQKKESEEKQEHLQIQEYNSEMLKKEIEQESDEGINPKLQPLLKEIIENFNFLENLTANFKELYGSAQNNQISKTEKKELKLLINLLKKVGPTKLMFFTSIKAIKRYANKEEFSNKAHLNHALNHFFTKLLQKNLELTYENVENKEKLKLKELINVKDNTIQKPRVFVSNRYSSKQYEKPKEKIKIKDYGFRLIKYMLKGHTYDEISKIIDYNYDSLINKKFKISRAVFNKLMALMNVDEIPHEIYVGNKVKIEINEDEDISELIGVMLGDGNLGLNGSKVAISLNRIDEEMYVKYIIDKLKTVFYDRQPIQSRNSFGLDIKPSKAVEITCFSKNLHYFFIENGLIPGDKVRNQVNVPDSIFRKRISIIKCIKGLFDTDGSIQVQMKNGVLRLGFTNASRPLVDDFKRICNNLGIKTGKVLTSISQRNGVQLTNYNVQIASKEHVQKFLKIVDPEKIKEPFRRIYLGTRLILANESTDLINIAKKEILKWNALNKQKTLIYNKENTIFLRDLCERLFRKKGITEIYGIRFNGKFKDKMFDRALNAALFYAPNHLKLKKSSKDIYHFPPVLRNQLCQYLFKILISSSTQLSTDELIELIKQKIIELKFLDIYEASTSFIYGKPITNYFKSLIFLIRYLIPLSKSSTPVVAKKVFDDIYNNSNWNQVHSYDIVREIIKNLIKTFPTHLNIKVIESNQIIEHLKIKGTATKHEIAKIIGKGLRAAYNKLIELEKKGIVKRNREKIGDPTFWSLAL